MNKEAVPAICQEMEAMFGMITWRPGVGDPTVVGWVTTVGYGVAAVLCARTGRQASANDECLMTNDEGDGKHRTSNIEHPTSNAAAAECKGVLNNEGTGANDAAQGGDKTSERQETKVPWLVLAIGLLFLGINKQLDLQTLLIQIGRDLAKAQGWFIYRRTIQFSVAVTAVALLVVGVYWLREKLQICFHGRPLLLIGTSLLGSYIALRLLAIDHVGEATSLQIPDLAWWLASMEIGGIACIGLGTRL